MVTNVTQTGVAGFGDSVGAYERHWTCISRAWLLTSFCTVDLRTGSTKRSEK